MTSIGESAFSRNYSLSFIYCYAVSCPEVNSSTFEHSGYRAVLYVPRASLSQYRNHNVWGKFATILPLDDISAINDFEGDDIRSEIEAVYDLNGHCLPALRPGVNIVKMSDGTTRKILVK